MVALLDIENIREGSCALKFSDDSTLSASEQRDLDPLERWSSAWGMKFNTKNVKLCPSPVGSHILPICITCMVKYCPCPDSQLSWDHSILLDELSWSSHVHSIHSRVNSTLGEEEPSALSCQT